MNRMHIIWTSARGPGLGQAVTKRAVVRLPYGLSCRSLALQCGRRKASYAFQVAKAARTGLRPPERGRSRLIVAAGGLNGAAGGLTVRPAPLWTAPPFGCSSRPGRNAPPRTLWGWFRGVVREDRARLQWRRHGGRRLALLEPPRCY